MASSRRRAIRSTWAQAVRNSVSSSFSTRLSKGEDVVLGEAPHGDDEGEAEALEVARVEVGEAGEFVRRQAVEPGGACSAEESA